MPEGWQWDPTLFAGSAAYYARGRLPYPPSLADVLARSLGLDGNGRLLDVGCGPGDIALLLAPLFSDAVGVDPDPDMLDQARRRARAASIGNIRWLQARAEELPLDLDPGAFRVATFASSFHWMDRDLVARLVYELLEPAGWFVLISAMREELPITAEVVELLKRYLGPNRRAGQGSLLFGTQDDENDVLARAGFSPPEYVTIPAGEVLVRSIDDLVATAFSKSNMAPHLFGDRLADFEADLRKLLLEHEPPSGYRMQVPETELRFWRR